MLLVHHLVKKGWILSKSLLLSLDSVGKLCSFRTLVCQLKRERAALKFKVQCIFSIYIFLPFPFSTSNPHLTPLPSPRRPVLWSTYLTSYWVLILAPAKSLKAKYELWFQKYNVRFPVKNEGKWNCSSRKPELQKPAVVSGFAASVCLRRFLFLPFGCPSSDSFPTRW